MNMPMKVLTNIFKFTFRTSYMQLPITRRYLYFFIFSGSIATNILISNGTGSFAVAETSYPTTYYVSGTGNDNNNGVSNSSPFRTIQKAADLTRPGDTVLVMNGVYANSYPTGNVLTITRAGTPTERIRYKAYPGHRPKLKFNGWNGIFISQGASYIEINGLEIEGNN